MMYVYPVKKMSIQYVIRTYHSIESDISMKNEMDNLIDVNHISNYYDVMICQKNEC